MNETDFDVIVIGGGVAGLSSALSALELAADSKSNLNVLLVDKSPPALFGGSSRYTQAYLRMKDKYNISDHLLEDSEKFSGGKNDISYLKRLSEKVPETIKWAEKYGVEFELSQTAFLTLSLPRWQPKGGGLSVVEAFLAHAKNLGLQVAYETTAWKLSLDESGNVNGVYVRDRNGQSSRLSCKVVILASGGFEGNKKMLIEHMGENATYLRSHIPNDFYHQGEGIKMAIDIGADIAGQWDSFHAEPGDSRNNNAVEPNIWVYQYGIVINILGERFRDEGLTTIEEQFDVFAKTVFKQPFNKAFFISDKTLLEIPGHERGILTGIDPIMADSLDELALKIGLDPKKLKKLIKEFNDSVQPGKFDPFKLDGKRTKGLAIEKTNWAVKIERPPFICYPLECRVNFTFGGIKTNLDAQVLDTNGNPIKNLYAVGEMTGLYHGKYLGGTSFLRSMVFGKIAGEMAYKQLFNK